MDEFELIAQFFQKPNISHRLDVALGIGDDCAVVEMGANHQLVLSMDTLVSGVHFPENTHPFDIGYKALAVNLSDLAAMGAEPAWFTLALTLPKADTSWLSEFSRGLFSLATLFNIELIGGDTTRGPLAMTIQVHGLVAKGKAITREGAQPGDLIYVTNSLGDAGLALRHIQQKVTLNEETFKAVLNQLNRPYPRIKEGLLLRDYATSMIDISDGLISDLGHILKRSNVGATLYAKQIPMSKELKENLVFDEAVNLALSAGDDYELCFTLPADKANEVETLMAKEHCIIHCVGIINCGNELAIQGYVAEHLSGYSHFMG